MGVSLQFQDIYDTHILHILSVTAIKAICQTHPLGKPRPVTCRYLSKLMQNNFLPCDYQKVLLLKYTTCSYRLKVVNKS